MNKIILAAVLPAIFAIVAFSASLSYCEDGPEKHDIKTFEGRVSSIDWVASKIGVNGVGTMDFYVPKDVTIRKLGSRIWLMDINILDNAIIRYYEDPSGVNITVDITITVV